MNPSSSYCEITRGACQSLLFSSIDREIARTVFWQSLASKWITRRSQFIREIFKTFQLVFSAISERAYM